MISWIRAQYDELTPYGRFFYGLGMVSLAVAAGMTFKFGWSMSVLHAFGLGVLSIVAAFLPESAYRLSEDGHKGLAVVVGLLAIPLLGVEYFSHCGYTVGQRVGNMQETTVQNTKYEAAQDSLASDKTNLEMWRKHLAELEAQAPWVATVKADAMRGEIEVAQKAIDLEAKRGGCGTKCQGLMKAKSELENRIGQAEQAADLAKKIEATQRILDSKTEVAAKTDFAVSPVVNQTSFVAKMVGWNLKPDAGTQEASQIGISASLALANVLLTPLCFLVAGRQRRRPDQIVHLPAVHARAEPLKPVQAPRTIVQREIIKSEPKGRPVSLLEAINGGMIAAH